MVTVGSHTVSWNMRKIVQGEAEIEGGRAMIGLKPAGMNTYTITKSVENVVDAHFVHDKWKHRNGDDAFVVLTKRHIYAWNDDD